MKIIGCFLLFIFYFISQNFGQNKCNCEAFIDWQYTAKIPIFDKPNGIVLDSISNDSINEDFIMMIIIESQNDYFKAIFQFEISDYYLEGWVRKSDYIGVYGRNYSGDVFYLYSEPNNNSKIASVVDTWIPETYTIVECNDDWAEVRMIYKNKVYNGWMEKKMRCPNPYTTCN